MVDEGPGRVEPAGVWCRRRPPARRVRAARSARASATKAQAMCASSVPVAPYSRAASRGAHAGGDMGEVVGDDLVGVGATGVCQPPRRSRHHRRGQRDRRRGRARDRAAGDPVEALGVIGHRRELGDASEHGHERGEHDGVVAGIDVGQRAQVLGHRPGPDAGGRFRPGVDDVEPGVADESRAAGPRCRDAARRAWTTPRHPTRPAEVIGSWATTHPPGRTAWRMRRSTTAGSTTCMRRKRQNARSTASGRSRSSPAWVTASTWLNAAAADGDVVPGAWIAVDGVDASFVAHDLGERHRHVPAAGARRRRTATRARRRGARAPWPDGRR